MTVAGIDYEFNVTLISEGAEDSASTNTEETLSGKDWAFTLEFDEPKLIVWNDETGTREVIDEGGTYQMQEGDVLGIYSGDEFLPYVSTEPSEFCTGVNMGSPFSIIEYALQGNAQTIHLEIELYNFESGEIKEESFCFDVITP